jgi:hypothetical protein
MTPLRLGSGTAWRRRRRPAGAGSASLPWRCPQARSGARTPRVRLAAGWSGHPSAVRAPRVSGGLARRAWLRTSRVGQDVLAVTLCVPGAYSQCGQDSRTTTPPDRARLHPRATAISSRERNHSPAREVSKRSLPASMCHRVRVKICRQFLRTRRPTQVVQLNDEGLAARFIRTARLSPEQNSARYARLVPFSFLILIGRFVTLEP